MITHCYSAMSVGTNALHHYSISKTYSKYAGSKVSVVKKRKNVLEKIPSELVALMLLVLSTAHFYLCDAELSFSQTLCQRIITEWCM